MRANLIVLMLCGLSVGEYLETVFRGVHYQGNSGLNVSSSCWQQLAELARGLGKFEEGSLWAWKMLDASSKLQSGILAGSTGDLGAFDECTRIKAVTSVGEVKGKYCLGTLTLRAPAKLQIAKFEEMRNFLSMKKPTEEASAVLPELMWAGCFPGVCSAEEMTRVYADFLEVHLEGALSFRFDEFMCQTDEEVRPKLSARAAIGIAVFAAVLAAMCLSTIYDLHLQRRSEAEPKRRILVAFSAYTNGKKLFKISRSEDPDQLSCLNGLRVISMMWVVLGHQYALYFGAISNGADVIEWMDSSYSMYIMGATVSVDTFFLLSGLLVVYGFLNATSNGGKLSVPLFWLHRYLRLTPPLAAVVLLDATLTEYIGSGPMWPVMKNIVGDNCRSYWWSALLYVQNYVNPNEICVGHSWYLSADMQLFVMSPLLLIPLQKWRKCGLAALVLTILISIAVPFAVAWEYDLRATFEPLAENRDFQTRYYLVTHARAAPWLIGALFGYCIFCLKKNKKPSFELNRATLSIFWVATLSVLIACVFGGHGVLRGGYEKWSQTSYIAFVRPAWAAALGFLIAACVTGHGGPINWILSLPIYQVLGRLTYSVYLTHLTVIYVRVASTRVPLYFSDYNNLYLFWGAMMFCSALSVLWVLAFESPMIAIEKALFRRTSKR